MATQIITMYQGDTLPALTRQLQDQNGNTLNLTGCTVALKTVSGTTTTTLGGTVTVTSASTGNISYAWVSSDTATPGAYQLWYIVTTTASGAKEHAVGPDTLIITTAP